MSDEQNSYVDLFSEPEVAEEVESEEVSEETEESTEAEAPEPEAEGDSEEKPEGEGEAEEAKEAEEKYVAKIEIDGKEFELDEPKIQHIVEQYVEVVKQNKELVKNTEIVEQAMGYIENIRHGKDIDDAMKALGVDFDKLIQDRVKDFIRRATMTREAREAEDIRKENERLRKEKEERELKEASAREEEEGRKSADQIFSSVQIALDKIPEDLRSEVQLELLVQIEKKIRQGGVTPSARAIANAASIIYERKKKLAEPKPKEVKNIPKPVKNSPTPQLPKKNTSRYNAEDYTKLFR